MLYQYFTEPTGQLIIVERDESDKIVAIHIETRRSKNGEAMKMFTPAKESRIIDDFLSRLDTAINLSEKEDSEDFLEGLRISRRTMQYLLRCQGKETLCTEIRKGKAA